MVNLSEELPNAGRLAGIDFGTVRVGIAISDPTQNWVTPLATYSRRTESQDAIYFHQLVQRESIVGFVIGLPIHCDGQESEKSRQVRSFAQWLHAVTQQPYCFYDERFSTAEAKRLMGDTGLSIRQKKARVDRLAAHLILSHFLTSQNSRNKFDAIEDTPTG